MRANSQVGLLAPIGIVVAAIVIFAGNYDIRKNDNGGLGPAIVTAVICVVLAAVLFGYVVPRARNVNRTAVILGVLGFLSIAVFWSGITPVLAAAALAVAPHDVESSRGARVAQGAAVVASVFALAVSLAQSRLF